MTEPATPSATTDNHSLLDGARICLVYEHSLSHYTRLLQEIAALQESGATVSLVTSNRADEQAPPGVPRTVLPLEAAYGQGRAAMAESAASWRPRRIAENLLRNIIRRIGLQIDTWLAPAARLRALRALAPQVDLFWVIDFPGLPLVMKAAGAVGTPVLYETVDLVPEYLYRGPSHRARALARERALVGKVDGFITACDSYADYYMERYGAILERRPVVRDNMPAHIANRIEPTRRPLRLLFFGSLMFDRPLEELLGAMALMHGDVTLTLQGKNLLAERLDRRIDELGIADKVTVLEPSDPDSTVEAARAYDIGVVALRGTDENERRASTSKLFTYMAAGLAVLGSDLPGIERVIREYDNGILVGGMNPDVWAAAIDRLAGQEPAAIDELKQRSLDAAHRHAWESQRAAFVAEFERALARGTTRRKRGAA